MKYIILIVSLTVGTISASCQKLGVKDLLSLYKMNFDDFDTYVTKKGYYHLSVETPENLTVNSYSTKNVGGRFSTRFISYAYSDKYKTTFISYQTSFSADYLEIKEQLKAQGFQYSGTQLIQGNTHLSYKKDSIEVRIILAQSTNKSGEITTAYEINIAKN